ncbi:MAG: AAA family ATPase [Desulfobacteraceae bacterium]|nr:AAA family ATPase [Desulfobacteraceae bacterium]
MRIRRFEAPDTTTALAKVKEEMGEDAVILASRTIAPVRGGVAKKGGETWVEVVAAMDYDLEEITGKSPSIESTPAASRRKEPPPAAPVRPPLPDRPALEVEISIEAQQLRKRLAAAASIQARPQPAEARPQPAPPALPRPQAPRPRPEEVAQWRDRLLDQLQVELPQRPATGKGPLLLALVGATGVGKTTTAAKLAAWYLLREGCKVALLSMDCYRIGATDQLRTYARIMRLPCEIALRKKELQQAIDRHRDKEVIIIDTAGKSPFDQQHIVELREWFAVAPGIAPYLTISATTKKEDLARVIESYAPIAPAGLMITKLDETRAYAGLCQEVVASALPVSGLGTGQRVPEDFLPASRGFLETLFKHGWQAVAPELQAAASPASWQSQPYRDIL